MPLLFFFNELYNKPNEVFMRKIKIQDIAEAAIIIALYVSLTYIFAPLSYGAIQFRISEILVLLVLYKKRYAVSLVIACFLANIGSSLGPWDMLFGTLATLVAIIPMLFIRNLYLGALFPILSNMFIVPFELGLALGSEMFNPEVFWFNVLTVGFGEAVVIYALGVPFMLTLSYNKALMHNLHFDEECIKYKPKFISAYITGNVFYASLFIIMYFAFPVVNNIDNERYLTLFDYTKMGEYYNISILVLASIFLIKPFIIKNVKVSIISTAILIILSMASLIVFAALNTDAFINGYFYLLFLILLFGFIPELNRYFSKRSFEE